MSLPKREKTGPQIKLLGVPKTQMILPVGWNTDNPWIVGKGDHEAYYGLANCCRACAENDTCYKDGWQDKAAASATCELWGID